MPLRRDPKMRKAGGTRNNPVFRCANPGCENVLNDVTVKNLDPFCSTACAHAFHGVEITLPYQGQMVASSS